MINRILAGALAVLVSAIPAVAVIDCDNNGAGTDGNITIHGGQVNMAGASLFADFFRQAASTNDWIDADTDGFFGFYENDPNFEFIDQLAPLYPVGGSLDTWWAFNYRSVGSVEGFSEFIDSQLCGIVPDNAPSEAGLFNRFLYADLGSIVDGWGGYVNSSGTPLAQCSIDGTILDVPGQWAITYEGTPKWNATPGEGGYGLNYIESSTGDVSQLQSLSRDCTTNSLNFDTADPNGDTLYSLVLAWVPIAAISNRGTGLEGLKFSEIQYLLVTGRMPNGENLVMATRDVGSGTRNGFCNTTNVDPSWGRGDNIGERDDSSTTTLLGHDFQPTNRGGSGLMENVVQNDRLAVGYTGVGGGSRAARDSARGFYEVLGVCKDVDQYGDPLCDCDSTGFVRPTIANVVDNCNACTGYQIGGSESVVVRGDPNANRDPGDDLFNSNGPAITNQAVADYLNNIFDSIAEFTQDPLGGQCANSYTCSNTVCSDTLLDCNSNGDCNGGATCGLFLDCTTDADCGLTGTCSVIRSCADNSDCDAQDYCGLIVNSPAQSMAAAYFLPAAIDCVGEFDLPLVFSPTDANLGLRAYTLANNGFGWNGDTHPYGSTNIAGLVPTRLALGGGAVYTDGQAADYVYWNGSSYVGVAAGNDLSARNRVQGDFNEDFARSINDATELVNAYYAPRAWQKTAAAIGSGGAGEMAADNAIPEVLGDFNGDGEFSKEDLRYFMDGLANSNGYLDRKAGAIAVDTQINALGKPCPWADTNGLLKIAPTAPGLPSASYPDPTFITPHDANDVDRPFLATGKSYAIGDFRGDVAGATLDVQGRRPNAGGPPTGWDGQVNAADIDYCCSFVRQPLAWDNLDDAVLLDLSCDMNGDLAVDSGDIGELVETILGTDYGDANLDGAVDGDDLAIVQATIAGGGCNAEGTCGWTDGDFTCDGYVDATDEDFVTGPDGDYDNDGDVDLADYAAFQVCFGSAATGACAQHFELSRDGVIDLDDYDALAALMTGPQ